MKRDVQIQYDLEVEYDENSEDFKRALDDFKSTIDRDATVESYVKHVALYVTTYGGRSMVEGAGYAKVDGDCVDEALYCGVNIDTDSPSAYIEFV